MGKCGCGPFKIHKKKVFALLRVITKVFLLCDTNASKMGKKLCVQCRKKIMQMPVEMPVEQSISSTSEELKSNDTTSVVASGTGTPDMSSSLLRTAESTSYVVSLLFRTLILLHILDRDIGLTL